METIKDELEILAIVKRAKDWEPGLHFFTPNDLAIQAGSWWYPAGKKLQSHKHRNYDRTVSRTQELAYVVKGSMQVEIFNEQSKKVAEFVLRQGDLAILIAGGHGYTILEPDTQVLEVKNGPFVSAEHDKEMIP